MIVRRCAGGVVFYANKVLLVKNDRQEYFSSFKLYNLETSKLNPLKPTKSGIS